MRSVNLTASERAAQVATTLSSAATRDTLAAIHHHIVDLVGLLKQDGSATDTVASGTRCGIER
eukprot:1023542-Amphidinium_carterae.1